MANNLINQRAKVITWFTGKMDFPVTTVKMASRDDAFLKQILLFIEEHYEDDFSIDTLSEYCCVSRTVFYNKIKGLTGLSPLEFVRKIKLKIAVQLLEKGSM
jgi:AraC-like DNA-binding protein